MKAYEYLLEFNDHASHTMKRMGHESGILDKRTQKLTKEMGRAEKHSKAMGREFENTRQRTMRLNAAFGYLKNGVAALLTVTALLTAGVKISKAASEYEQIGIAFETMLGSAKRSKKTIRDLNEFANNTPFTNDQVFKSSKSLLAYNVQAKELIPTLRALGDISSGVGREKLPNLILAFGQVKAASRLTGMELRQFTEAGVPLLDELAKVTGKTVATIKEEMIPKGKVSFELFKKALFNATKEGGKFFRLMEKQSKSFGGRVSTLTGKAGLLSIAYGKSLNKKLRPAIETAIKITDKLIESTRSSTDKYIDQSKKVKQLQGEYGPLIEQYRQLSDKTKRSTEEETKLKTITEQLGDALPGIVTKWDRFGKAVALSGDEFQRFTNLNKEYLKEINKDALSDANTRLQVQVSNIDALDRELNSPKKFKNTIPGRIARDHYEKNKNRIDSENLSKFKALIGDESGFGKIGETINEIRKLNGLRALSAKQIADFDPVKIVETKNFGKINKRKTFGGFHELLTKKIDPAKDNGLNEENGTAVKSSVKEGIDGITAGGGKNVTVNFQGGIKFAESIEITAQDIGDGLDQLEPKMKEFFIRLLQGGLHTATGS